jgi:nitrite reductase/ring-hydroxylating ferredoxin subunit
MKTETVQVKIATRRELPASGKAMECFSGERTLCVVNLDGEIYVMDNNCPHWGGPLGQGVIENGKLRCPWHQWEFDPRTGITPRKVGVIVPTYKVKIEGDDVYVELDVCVPKIAQNGTCSGAPLHPDKPTSL